MTKRSRAGTNAVLAATRISRNTVESRTPPVQSLPDATANEPPKLTLNTNPDLASESQMLCMRNIISEPSVIEDSAEFPRPRGISLSSETRPLSSKSVISDIYTARWKISASEILDLLQNDSGLIKDVKHRFSQHKNVIIGSELVSYFVAKRICQNRQDAVDLGHHLLLDDILQHEYQEHVFKDKYLFYIISSGAARNAANIGASSDESDNDFNELITTHDESYIALQNSSTRHSALSQHLNRRPSTDGHNDYFRDARLQDDDFAAAAADRCFLLCLRSSHFRSFVLRARHLLSPEFCISDSQCLKMCTDICKTTSLHRHRTCTAHLWDPRIQIILNLSSFCPRIKRRNMKPITTATRYESLFALVCSFEGFPAGIQPRDCIHGLAAQIDIVASVMDRKGRHSASSNSCSTHPNAGRAWRVKIIYFSNLNSDF
jgi:hypothetical protein